MLIVGYMPTSLHMWKRKSPRVVPGQIWEDGDRRCAGRTLQVLEIFDGGKLKGRVARCKVLTEIGGDPAPEFYPNSKRRREVTIQIRRFRDDISSGYKLVEDVTD